MDEMEKMTSEATPQPLNGRGAEHVEGLPLITSNDPQPQTLTEKAMESLRDFFETQTQHRPSPAMWEALEHLALTMEDMANGECPQAVYLSSLDPGVGKTQTITHFIQALMESPDHGHVGVLVCLSRLDEIRSMVEEIGLDKEDFGVMTSDPTLNQLGRQFEEHDKARVLFTTQQMVETRCQRKSSFAAVEPFHFQSEPRMVRLWDESMLPGTDVILKAVNVASLIEPLGKVSSELQAVVSDMYMAVQGIEDGSTYLCPNLTPLGIRELRDLTLPLLGESPGILRKVETLWNMSGKWVKVDRAPDNKFNTVLTYKNTLPEDLLPILVLDASGRVRTTYDEMERHRGNLVRLPEATKYYRDLSAKVWLTSGSKTAFRNRDKREMLVTGIVKTIESKPDEKWLVVHHLPESGRFGFDVEKEVLEMMGDAVDTGPIEFITWGNHHATNKYRIIKNVILAGTLFYPGQLHESRGRLCADLPVEEGEYPADRRREIERGEHAHLILQALCRASVRQCIGDQCAPCDAYIIASPQSGIKDLLPSIFPG